MKKIVWLMNLQNQAGNDYSPEIYWWNGVLERFGYQVFYESYETYDIDDLYKKIKNTNPDYFIHTAYSIVHPEFERLKELTDVYVMQIDDRWRFDNFGKHWIPAVDGIITFEGDLEKYEAEGLNIDKFCKMRWAYNPNTMTIDGEFNKNYKVSHTGGLHADRMQLLKEFQERGVSVYVSKFDGYAEAKVCMAESKYSLCFTMNSMMNTREMKGRLVEIPAFASALVTQPFPDMEMYYDIEKDIILFETVEEAIDKMNYYDANDKEYFELVDNGRRKLWNSLTTYHEWNKILPIIDKDFEPIDVQKLLKTVHKEHYFE